MFQLCRKRFDESYLGNLCMAIVVVLCLFVLVHMLGVPVTLMNPVEAADTIGASVLEGFSVPPTVPHITLSSETLPVAGAQPSMHVPVLTTALFHPHRV